MTLNHHRRNTKNGHCSIHSVVSNLYLIWEEITKHGTLYQDKWMILKIRFDDFHMVRDLNFEKHMRTKRRSLSCIVCNITSLPL